MSFATATEAQKTDAAAKTNNVAKLLYTAVSGGQSVQASDVDASAKLAATALAALGASGTTDKQSVVSDGQTVDVGTGTVTLHVAGGKLTATYAAKA